MVMAKGRADRPAFLFPGCVLYRSGLAIASLKRQEDAMKTCPECGKNVPDHATTCKYCGHEIPESPQMTTTPSSVPDSNSPYALQCPACGAALSYTEENAPVKCPYCGNAVVLPHTADQARQPATGPTLSQKVEQLLAAGRTTDAIRLLRDEAFLQVSEAESLIDRIEAGHSGSVRDMILKAQRRE
jgi:DNA-directed RNA polymerase subunit RPC12/RpoP